jgi:hypothetical protein
MYLTNKRLILVEAGEDNLPTLDARRDAAGKIKQVNIGTAREDSSNFTAFPLNNIYGVSIKLKNKVSNNSIVKPRERSSSLGILGGILLAFGFLFMVLGFMSEADEMTFFAMIMIIIGIVLLVVSYGKEHEITRLPQSIEKIRLLNLVTLDPVYMNRASLKIEVDDTKHNIKDIIQWCRELQNRCEAISKPKTFEKRMMV